MADRNRETDGPNGEPVNEDDFDKALKAAEAAYRARNEVTETPEPDEDEEEREEAPTNGEPEDDDTEDTEEDEEGDSTDDDVDSDEDPDLDLDDAEDGDTSQEPNDKPESRKKDEDPPEDDVDFSKLSRKQRGQIISKLQEQLTKEQEQTKQLEQQAAEEKQKKEELQERVNKALGTKEDYQKAMDKLLDPNVTPQEREYARRLKVNREFYAVLLENAEGEVRERFSNAYWETVQKFPGVDQSILKESKTLGEVLQNLHAAGYLYAKKQAESEQQKLTKKIKLLEGRIKEMRPKATATTQREPTTGGRSPSAKEFNWRKDLTDPKTGMLTDEAEEKARKYGIQKVLSGEV